MSPHKGEKIRYTETLPLVQVLHSMHLFAASVMPQLA